MLVRPLRPSEKAGPGLYRGPLRLGCDYLHKSRLRLRNYFGDRRRSSFGSAANREESQQSNKTAPPHRTPDPNRCGPKGRAQNRKKQVGNIKVVANQKHYIRPC